MVGSSFLTPNKNEADRKFDPPRDCWGNSSCFYLLAWLARTVNLDLYRAAAFACSTPFCTDLSMTEITSGNIWSISCFEPESSAPRNFLVKPRTLVRLLRLIARRFSFCRTRFSADL